MAELEEHQAQMALRGRARPANQRVEVAGERGGEYRVIQQRIHPRQLLRQLQRLVRKQRLPQRGLITYGAEQDGLDPS